MTPWRLSGRALKHDPMDTVSWNGLGIPISSGRRFEDAVNVYQLEMFLENNSLMKIRSSEFEKSFEAPAGAIPEESGMRLGNIYFHPVRSRMQLASYKNSHSNSIRPIKPSKANLSGQKRPWNRPEAPQATKPPCRICSIRNPPS